MIVSTQRFDGRRQLLLALATLLILVPFLACSGGGGSGSSPTSPVAEGTGGGTSGGTGGGGTSGSGGTGGSGGSGGGTVSTGGNDTGMLRITMRDAPIDEVSELWVFVTGLRVKHEDEPVRSLETNAGLYDLLLLTNGVSELLVADEVLAGRYQFIEILLDQDQSFVVEAATGESRPLQIPSEKVKLKGGPFDVLANGTTSVLFDFDAEKSLKQKGNGDWQLKPFVSIVDVVEDGA